MATLFKSHFSLSLTFAFISLVLASSEVEFLLTFKTAIKDPVNYLSTWSNTSQIHHCNWTGVACTSTANPFTVTSINLQSFNLSGEISPSICQLHNLTHLNLANNLFDQPIPLPLSQCTSLEILDLSNNLIWGTIPEKISQLGSLRELDLSRNHIEGKIPISIGECMNLEKFQVQNNGFSGDLPTGLWKLPKIKVIRAENNGFSGRFPDSIPMASQLEQVQIDNNNLVSKIPHGMGMIKSLYRFSASRNGFYGELPPNFCDSPVMSIINLSHNSISGRIPEVEKCSKLVSLSLADNNLLGEIPNSLAELPVLTYLDLSDNNLTGSIPPGLQNLKLALFNLSFNRLSGEVPSSLISGLPASFLEGNPGLCGPGLPNSCSEEKNPTNDKAFSLSVWAGALISVAFTLLFMFLVLGLVTIYRSSNKTSSWNSVLFYPPLRITENDVIMGMEERSLLGNGGVLGRVYVVEPPSSGEGELVVVKRLLNSGNQSFKALKNVVKTLANIRHKNVARILGFFHSDEAIFLIYEFMQKGSLGDLIRRSDAELQWSVRLKIAIGIAQGLAYLHRDYSPHILHRNVKSNNIVLGADFEPKITDFALDRIVGEAAFRSSMASKPAFSCYRPPEFGYCKKATEQMDVYSFGIVLLELVSGRKAEETKSEDRSLDLLKWVRRKINIKNGAIQILDPKIMSSAQNEMMATLEIALLCTSVMPEKRPSMLEVLRALESLSSKC